MSARRGWLSQWLCYALPHAALRHALVLLALLLSSGQSSATPKDQAAADSTITDSTTTDSTTTPHSDSLCTPTSPAALKQQIAVAQSLPAALPQHLSAFLAMPQLSTLQQSADGQWVWYWRTQGRQFWLARSRGDGEEQVLLRQPQPFQHWLAAADQSGIWLADHDQVLFFDLRRRQLQKIWSTGTPLPGQRDIATAADSEVWQLESAGGGFAIVHRLVKGQHQYWQLQRDKTAKLLYQQPSRLQSIWFSATGQLSAMAQLQGTDEQQVIWQTQPAKHTPVQASAQATMQTSGLATGDTRPLTEVWRCANTQFCRIRAVQGEQLWLVHQPDGPTAPYFPAQLLSTLTQPKGTQTAASPTTRAQLPAELTELLRHPDGAPLALAYVPASTEPQRWQAIDPSWAPLIQQLQQEWPASTLQLQLAHHQQGYRLLVSLQHASVPSQQHWWLTLNAQAQIIARQPLLLEPAPATLADPPNANSGASTSARANTTQFVCWRSRDGQTVPGYLSLPTGRSLQQSPIILLPHGGPWLQSTPTFDPLVQMLVNQGFIVLQPNYRGSSGYGHRWLSAAGSLDRAPLLADLFSGLDFLLAHQIGEPRQQLVLGHSFGAYLALQAASVAPTRFKAVIALAPPLQLANTFARYAPQHDNDWRRRLQALQLQLPSLGVLLQNPQWQQQMQQQAVPAQRPAITVPLYLWVGARDERVDANAIVQWASALQHAEQNAAIQFYLDPLAEHWPTHALSRASLFYLIWHVSQTQLQAAPPLHLPAIANYDLANSVRASATSNSDLTIDRLEQYLQEIKQIPID